MTESRRRLAAIMFTDMVGYSALAQSEEAAALAALERHNRILRPIFPKFRGREIKTVGDAFLVEFDSALDAARCALDLQQALRDHNDGSPGEWKIRIRVGIHVGDVVETDGDVLGDAVNIASRIEPLADPEGICLTQQVYDQVQNKITAQFARLPPVVLKNIRLPMNVYKMSPLGASERAKSSRSGRIGGPNLAVLPLANISPDPNDEYFADGLTEELISRLSQVRDLSVIARTSVMPYKLAPKSILQVGAELGVDAVLEGSVRKAGKRIRITLQLIDVLTQRHVWASSYDRDIDDVFAVQSDIAERTAGALQLEFSRRELPRGARKPTADPLAYELFLRGLATAGAFQTRDLEEAVRCFDQATKRDPTFAEAYAAWANLYVVVAGDSVPMQEVMPKARELAARALELDPDSSAAHAAMANIALQFDHNWGLAESEFRTAISLNPSNATAHRFFGLLLVAQERFEEAIEMFQTAVRLDPAAGGLDNIAWTELESGNFDVAIATYENDRDRDPSQVGPHVYLGLFYLAAGRPHDARREADTPLIGADETERFDHALLNALVGRPEAARAVLAEAEHGGSKSYNSATDLAMLYAAIGDKPRALDLLEKDLREGDRVLWLYYRGVFFDSIREDPRFIALLQQYGVPTHPLRRPTPAGT
ncbi:MAG: adenylate/guanylate cyclase domain-containing protein [Thermoplasmata archaeon]